MIKVIETNLSLNEIGEIADHQARVIEVESWDSLINEIENGETKVRESFFGSLSGCTIPKKAKIINLTYDKTHVMCDIINYAGMKIKKLIYKV